MLIKMNNTELSMHESYTTQYTKTTKYSVYKKNIKS